MTLLTYSCWALTHWHSLHSVTCYWESFKAKSLDALPFFCLFVFLQILGFCISFHVCCHEGRKFSERVTKANGVCLGHYTFSSRFIIDWRTEARPATFCVRKYWCCSFSSRNRLLGSFSHPLLNFSFLVFFFGFFCISCQFGLFSLSRFFHFCPTWLIKKCKKTNESSTNR